MADHFYRCRSCRWRGSRRAVHSSPDPVATESGEYQAGVAFQNAEEWEAAKGEHMQIIIIDVNCKEITLQPVSGSTRPDETKKSWLDPERVKLVESVGQDL